MTFNNILAMFTGMAIAWIGGAVAFDSFNPERAMIVAGYSVATGAL